MPCLFCHFGQFEKRKAWPQHWPILVGTPIFPGFVSGVFRIFFFFFRVFFPTAFACCFCFCFCFLLLLLLLIFASAFASAFAFCFWPLLLHLLLLFAFPSAFAFTSALASADYLLCIDTATKLDDKTFTLSFDTQLHQSRNEAAQRCLYLICIAGEALRPAPHPLPLSFLNSCHYRPPPLLFPIPLSLGPPRYESYHSYHNYYFLCVDAATKVDFYFA